MKQDPITSAYLKVINENASNGKVEGQSLKVGEPYGDPKNKVNTSKFYAKSGTERVEKDIETPEEAPCELTTDGSENKPKELKKGEKLTLKGEAKNPFDVLFNKIISEDSFDFETGDNTLKPDSNFGGPEGIGHVSGDEDEENEFESDEDEEGEDEGFGEEEESPEELFAQLKDLVAKIGEKLGVSEEGDEEGEIGEDGHEFEDENENEDEFEDEDEEDEENPFGEAVDAEVLGYALVDQEKLEAGHTKKTSFTVKGAVPVKKKSAQIVKGKKVNGKPEDFKNESGISSLQGKNNNVGGVKTGRSHFDQE